MVDEDEPAHPAANELLRHVAPHRTKAHQEDGARPQVAGDDPLASREARGLQLRQRGTGVLAREAHLPPGHRRLRRVAGHGRPASGAVGSTVGSRTREERFDRGEESIVRRDVQLPLDGQLVHRAAIRHRQHDRGKVREQLARDDVEDEPVELDPARRHRPLPQVAHVLLGDLAVVLLGQALEMPAKGNDSHRRGDDPHPALPAPVYPEAGELPRAQEDLVRPRVNHPTLGDDEGDVAPKVAVGAKLRRERPLVLARGVIESSGMSVRVPQVLEPRPSLEMPDSLAQGTRRPVGRRRGLGLRILDHVRDHRASTRREESGAALGWMGSQLLVDRRQGRVADSHDRREPSRWVGGRCRLVPGIHGVARR